MSSIIAWSWSVVEECLVLADGNDTETHRNHCYLFDLCTTIQKSITHFAITLFVVRSCSLVNQKSITCILRNQVVCSSISRFGKSEIYCIYFAITLFSVRSLCSVAQKSIACTSQSRCSLFGFFDRQ